jgi:hypothetical protein
LDERERQHASADTGTDEIDPALHRVIRDTVRSVLKL